jgi:diguanylate cyclase (GGDEF)-like protein
MGVVDLALAGGLLLALLLLVAALLRVRSLRRRYGSLVDNLPQSVVVVFDRDLRVKFAGGSAADFAGRTPEQIEGEFVLGHIPQAQRDPLLIHYRAALRGEQRSFEFRSSSTGRDYWVRVVPLVDKRGRVTGGISLALDVSDRSQDGGVPPTRSGAVDAVTDATRALARSVEPVTARAAVCEGARRVAGAPVAALLEPTLDGGTLVVEASSGIDLDGLQLALGDGGISRAFTTGEDVFVALGNGDGESDREFLRRAQARAVLWHPVVGDRAVVGVLAVAWHEAVAGVSLTTSTLIDLLASEAAVAIGRADLLGQLEHLARTDPLTGLPNRRFWEQHLPGELARAGRETAPLCVAMLDLDHFKAYNDRRGHQAGDRLLADAAVAWRGALRPYDVLARYGGEEFSLILPGCDLEAGVALVERLRAFTPHSETASAGIAEWDGDEPADSLVGRADAALYQAKRAGRDRVVAGQASSAS